MSFTANIVNIHRTIIHVLAFQRGGGNILVFYFTRTPQNERERKKLKGLQGKMNIKLLFEVRLFSVQFD